MTGCLYKSILLILIALLGSGCGHSNESEVVQTEAEVRVTKAELPKHDDQSAKAVQQGTLVVDLRIKDPNAVVSIDGNEYPSQALAEPISLPVGEHEVAVMIGGEAFNKRRVTIANDKRQFLQLSDSDREAAEWVLGIGGWVRIVIDGQEREVRNSADLPQQRFAVIWFDTAGKPMSDADLIRLEGLTHLETVSMWHASVTDQGVGRLREFSDLKVVGLPYTQITGDGLGFVAGLGNLHTLRLQGTHMNDAGLAFLKNLTKLEILTLDGTDITDAGLAHISGLTQLRELNISGTKVKDAGLTQLQGLTNLRFLGLSGIPTSDAGLQGLNCLELEQLYLQGSSISDLHNLHRFKRLALLSVAGSQVGDAGVRNISQMESLSAVDFDGTKITDDGLKELAALPKLSTIGLAGTEISDMGIAHLKPLTNLTHVRVIGTKVTDAGVADLKQALPNCLVEK